MLSILSPDQIEILSKLLNPRPDQKEILFKWLEIIFGVLLIISVILLIIFISKKKKGSTSLKLSIASIITNLEIVLFSAYMKAYYESYVAYSDNEAPPVFGYIFTGVGIVFFISVVVAIVLKLILINKKKKGKSKEEINKHLNTLLTVSIVLIVCCLAFMVAFCVITFCEPYYSKYV